MATNPAPSETPVKDPYSSTEVKTIEIAGPIKITLTTKYDASHVPPAPEAHDDERGASGIMEALRPLAEAILQKLEEIRQNQNPQ